MADDLTTPDAETGSTTTTGVTTTIHVREPGGRSHVELGTAQESGDELADVLDAVLSVASGLELPGVLERFVRVSVELTGARYGAINVLDSRGESTTFVQTGVPATTAALMGHPRTRRACSARSRRPVCCGWTT